MSKKALEGIKVADFTWAVAGPFMTKYLADYGATVVRVESRDHPCFLRSSGPYKKDLPRDPNTTGYFAFFNANKYSMSLNFDEPKGIEVAKRLIQWADVVTESFVPGTLAKKGLDFESIRKMKPDIIMASSSGQGQTGPSAQIPIAGNWLVALTGFAWLSGWPDLDPAQPFGAYTDFIAPRFGAAAIILALRYRNLTGKGQYIDLAQTEGGLQTLIPAVLDYTVNGRPGARNGNSSPCAVPHGVYPCKHNRWCALSVSNDEEWRCLCHCMGNPSWTSESEFDSILKRKQNENELNKLVSMWTSKFTAEEVMTLLQSVGVPAGVVESAKDVSEDPQLEFRNEFWTLDHKVIGKYKHLGQAAILSSTPAQPYMPAPLLGEHTEYVCKEFLNMSDKQFVELFNDGIFGR